MDETLQLRKFEGVDFKYDNNFFQIPPNTQIRQFWSRALSLFVFFHETLQFLKFQRADFKHGNSLFMEVPA